MDILKKIALFMKNKLTSRKWLLAGFVIYGLITGMIPVEVQKEVVVTALGIILAELGLDYKRMDMK